MLRFRFGGLFVAAACLTGFIAGSLARADDPAPLPAPAALPAHAPLMTRWAKNVDKNKPLPDYPRPQMERNRWQTLNGQWNYALTDKAAQTAPVRADGQITVPFPLESALSGVQKPLGAEQKLWYQRTFTVPDGWDGSRILLHFGAVNYDAQVQVNGQAVMEHKGGYDAFDADITNALRPGKDAVQQITVSVLNPLDASQVRGKQVRKPGGIFYTPVTGIWQSVWMEPVPKAGYISGLQITPDVDKREVRVRVQVAGIAPGTKPYVAAMATYLDNGKPIFVKGTNGKQHLASAQGQINGHELTLSLPPSAALWTPEKPTLYGLRVFLVSESNNNKAIEQVESYFALRKISLGKDSANTTRILLNNEPIFQSGVLDQGYWPDGIYTAPTDDALRYDIEAAKKLGFNMIRKHAKVEPDRWYYWADKLGMLVWQDMPQAFEANQSAGAKAQFDTELRRLVAGLTNHPSIVFWTLFNEGWGQHDTETLAAELKSLDPSRLVNSASGWTDKNVGDVHDMHKYPAPGSPAPEPARAAVLGEYGGLGMRVNGHMWQDTSWGYQGLFKTGDQLTRRYAQYGQSIADLQKTGLSATVYTQLTDVETESNGLLTYDRAVIKPDAKIVAAANRGVFLPLPAVAPNPALVPTSEEAPQIWHYSTDAPTNDLSWTSETFNDTAWKTASAGFGHDVGPIKTEWNTPDIWLRREFTLADKIPAKLAFSSFHDEDVEIYLNGVLAATATGFVGDYTDIPMNAQGRAALKPGRNVLAVHCHQTVGGQFIDVGIVPVK